MNKNFSFPQQIMFAVLFSVCFSPFANAVEVYPRTAPTVVDFQIFRAEEKVRVGTMDVTLINLNKHINAWYLLKISGRNDDYNIENSNANKISLTLNQGGLVLEEDGVKTECDIFTRTSPNHLATLAQRREGYVPFCGGKLYLRQQGSGNSTWLSWGSDLLKDYGAAAVVDAVKVWRGDSGLVAGNLATDSRGNVLGSDPNRPARANVSERARTQANLVGGLKIDLLEAEPGRPLLVGEWYTAKYQNGIYFSSMIPGLIHEQILSSHRDRVNTLDSVESNAQAYMVAFDLSNFEMGWSHGTSQPGVGWSERAEIRHNGPGPDGFSNLSPLKLPGIVNPALFNRLIGVMCGGFQRRDSAFRRYPRLTPQSPEDLGSKNFGSHNGFIENGVTMSRLNPGLVTLISYSDGTVDMKTWTEQDNQDLPRIRFARQNGVPLVERTEAGVGIPGLFVKDWGRGNWNGSENGQKRSQRAGACISVQNGRRYLMYGYFTATNPDGMARTFQAYGCRDAMHLDMNSASQGYLGLISNKDGRVEVENPVAEMARSNKVMTINGNSVPAPRFVGEAQVTDFFYFLRKQP